MANSELSKLKILYMYDYFKTCLNTFDPNSTISVSDLIAYLEEKTGTVFERKSIYADINKINEYINKTHKVKGNDNWITTEGRKYKRNQLEDEITIDEARLIVDAIKTTTFVDTQLCEKITNMFPTYFTGDYNKSTLAAHDMKISRRMISWLLNIRNAISDKIPLKIKYGYKLGNELTDLTDRVISPLLLDWENNCYYLIAIDNNAAEGLERDQSLSKAIRRYRFDRMANVSFEYVEFVDFKTEKLRKQELDRFMNNSLSAFSSERTAHFEMTIKGQTRKDTLKAYGAFSSHSGIEIKIVDDTKLDKGILRISVTTGRAPTLYTDLFELSTFESVDIEIHNDEICNEYKGYVRKAAAAAKLEIL